MKRILLLSIMLALTALFSGSALAQVDHFRCYVVPAAPTLAVNVQLQDQFDSPSGTFENITSLTAEHFCNPVQKTVNGVVTPIVNVNHHLTMYRINPQSTINRMVVVHNQFGQQTLSVAAPEILAVPTGKSIPPTPPPSPSTDLDHYKCYAASGPSLVNVTATLADQFRTDVVHVIQPVRFCNPVEKIHNGVTTHILNPTIHLVCYSTTIVTSRNTINTKNQFVTTSGMTVQNPDLLCAPSTKLSWKEVTGTASDTEPQR